MDALARGRFRCFFPLTSARALWHTRRENRSRATGSSDDSSMSLPLRHCGMHAAVCVLTGTYSSRTVVHCVRRASELIGLSDLRTCVGRRRCKIVRRTHRCTLNAQPTVSTTAAVRVTQVCEYALCVCAVSFVRDGSVTLRTSRKQARGNLSSFIRY